MILGLAIFAILAVVVVGAFVATTARRRAYDETLAPEDQLTDEQFRQIEFGDDD